MSHEFETKLSTTRELISTENKSIVPAITARLKEDDRALQSLEQLLSRLGSSKDDIVLSERSDGLAAKLAELTAVEMHCRLDRLYLQASLNGTTGASAMEPEEIEDQSLVLKEELASLYPEIGVLAEMSARQQFMEPILHELHIRHGRLQSSCERKLDYVRHPFAACSPTMGLLTD